MPFSGKATYAAGETLPELVEDVSDIITIVSPHETPLLDHLGDPMRSARSTVHEWLEDTLLPNIDAVNQSVFTPSPTAASTVTVDNPGRFRAGDLVKPAHTAEVMLVTLVAGNNLSVTRGYGGTPAVALADNMPLRIIGNAALEGDDRPVTRFTNRVRRANYTQIFTSSVEASGSQLAVKSIGVADEIDYQKQERLRELLRDLENCVINGVAPAATQVGSASVRRTMNGIIPSIVTNRFAPGVGAIPEGDGEDNNLLTENMLNSALKEIWENSAGTIDTILVNGFQKRRVNSFVAGNVGYAPSDSRYREMVSVYESDFGVARVILSRFVPPDTIVLLDSSRIDVLPLVGRSFHYKPLASSGDAEVGQVIGEYTLEMRNEIAHALISGLATAA